MKFVLLLFLLVSLLFSQDIKLTTKEKNFIKNNPTITLGGGKGFEPFLIKNLDGSYSGYDVDIINQISKNTGLKVKLIIDDWDKIQEQASEKKLDGITTGIRTDSRDKIYNATIPYLSITPLVIVKVGNPKQILTPKDLHGKKVAIQSHNKLQIKIANSIKDIEIIYYKSINDIMKAVVSKEVDFAINDITAFYKAREIGLGGLIESPFIIGDEIKLVFNLRKDQPELVSIFNKGLKSITQKEFFNINNDWFNISTNKRNIDLYTEKEKQYLSKKKELKLCIDPDWLPFSKYKDGKYYGISADIYKLVQERIPIPMNIVATKNWSESLSFAKNKQCDILEFAIKTPLREEYLNFTKKFLKIPMVIVTKTNIPFIYNFLELKDKLIAIPENYAYIELLKKSYPFLQIIEVKNVEEGLKGVKAGKYYGYVGALASTSFAIKENFTGELKVTGRFDENYEMGSAVIKEDLVLLGILNKALSSISQEQIDNIVNKWIYVKYEKGFDYAFFGWFLGIALFIFLIFFYKNYLLKKQIEEEIVKSRKKDNLIFQQHKMVSLGEMVGNIAHQWRQPLAELSMIQNYLLERLKPLDNIPNDVLKEIHNGQETLQYMSNTIKVFESIYITNNQTKDSYFNLLEAVNKSASISNDALKQSGITSNFDIDESIFIKGDINTFIHVLNSITQNSIYFLKNRKIPQAKIEFFTLDKEKEVLLCIKDNAGGIKLDNLNQVFEYGFSQRDNSENSTGLGLYIAKLIIDEKFSGHIEVKNQNDGAEFKLLLKKYTLENE